MAPLPGGGPWRAGALPQRGRGCDQRKHPAAPLRPAPAGHDRSRGRMRSNALLLEPGPKNNDPFWKPNQTVAGGTMEFIL